MVNARALGFLLLVSSPAIAAPEKPAVVRVADAPCAGCRAAIPSAPSPVPLLVVLHGDWGYGAADLLATWERHALSRGVAVLALACPRSEGCKGSWWQWNGDPAWVRAQVEAFAAKHAIDRERVWLAGWSGGATYMGLRAQAFQRSFAALVYHGGGIAPLDAACGAPEAAAPVFFLVGSGNPLHSHAVALRAHHDGCHDDVTWKLLPKADHPAEWRALDERGGAIVDWLLTKRRRG